METDTPKLAGKYRKDNFGESAKIMAHHTCIYAYTYAWMLVCLQHYISHNNQEQLI